MEKIQEALALTVSINQMETKVAEMREERRKLIIELRQQKVTARALSDLLGMSEQNVHKIVKGK